MIKKLEIKTVPVPNNPALVKNVGMDNNSLFNKINELVDAVNELQNRIDPPSVYQVMKDKDAIIGKHIGEKQRLQDELDRTRKALDIAINVLNRVKDVKYEEYIDEKLEQINEITKGGDNE